jgi:hypothetical protein
MTAKHAEYEVLCALAASGQLTGSELAELYAHSQTCPSCNDRLLEIAQVSAQLFCAHAMSQPRSQMPNDMLDRFIARANNEGIPLTPRAASVGFTRPALTAAFLLALLLLSATFHLGFLAKSPDETMRPNSATISSSIRDKSKAPLEVKSHIASANAQAPRTFRGPKARGRRQSSGPDSATPEQSPFDLTVYSQNLAMFHRPFFVTAKLDHRIQWAPARYATPKFQFPGPSEFAKNEPPRLFAEYEHRTFAPFSPQEKLAPGSPDPQVIRLDFNPNAYRTLLNPDFKKNLPSFQFTPNASE